MGGIQRRGKVFFLFVQIPVATTPSGDANVITGTEKKSEETS